MPLRVSNLPYGARPRGQPICAVRQLRASRRCPVTSTRSSPLRRAFLLVRQDYNRRPNTTNIGRSMADDTLTEGAAQGSAQGNSQSPSQGLPVEPAPSGDTPPARCADCACWQPLSPEIGECRRYPPTIIPIEGGAKSRTAFPRTGPLCWCVEFIDPSEISENTQSGE